MDMWRRDTIGLYRVYKVYIKRNDNDKFVKVRVQKNSKERISPRGIKVE